MCYSWALQVGGNSEERSSCLGPWVPAGGGSADSCSVPDALLCNPALRPALVERYLLLSGHNLENENVANCSHGLLHELSKCTWPLCNPGWPEELQKGPDRLS